MRTLVTSIKVVSIFLVCLSLLAVPAIALDSQNKTSCAVPGFQGYDRNRYPGSTEFCTKWIPGHWIPIRMMVPGRVVHKPVWIPGYPITRRQWKPGFWQTTSYHARPDVFTWGTQPK